MLQKPGTEDKNQPLSSFMVEKTSVFWRTCGIFSSHQHFLKMGKLKVFEVVFNGAGDLFRPGEWVQGHLKIVLSEPKSDIRGKLLKQFIYIL